MASARALAWLDGVAWMLIYGGCIGLILGVATGEAHLVAGWSLGVLGGVAVAAGVVLILVRSRLKLTPGAGAQSTGNDNTRGKT